MLCCMGGGGDYKCSQLESPWTQNLGLHESLRVCASLLKMNLPGQEEFEVSSACENVPTGELDSGPGSGPSPNGLSDTDRGELGVPKDPLLFIQLNELLGWPHALEWRETGR